MFLHPIRDVMQTFEILLFLQFVRDRPILCVLIRNALMPTKNAMVLMTVVMEVMNKLASAQVSSFCLSQILDDKNRNDIRIKTKIVVKKEMVA